MDKTLLARLGLARLRLPIPMAKLSIVNAAAELLDESEDKDVLWNALVQWMSELELESEILEALCIPLLARCSTDQDVAVLQRAIKCPSPLSHLYLGEISGQPLQFISWAKSHSGESPVFFSADEIEDELTAGHIVPHILATRILSLEDDSGFPFLKQWAYEFQCLVDIYGDQSDGHWEYFVDGERGRDSGYFITRRGHLARSAFLRTLAAAYDLWDMPEHMVYAEAEYATVADFPFLRILPGGPPSWAHSASEESPASRDECQTVLDTLIQKVKACSQAPELLHLDMPLASNSTFQGECEVISCLHDGTAPEALEVFKLHNYLLGHLEFPRRSNWDIQITSTRGMTFSSTGGGQLIPSLVPSVGRTIGYFSSDLIRRTPYLPANIVNADSLIARSRRGGMDILLKDKPVGSISYWNQGWKPTHDKALGPHCGVCLCISKSAFDNLFSSTSSTLGRFWRATILTREKDYGEWKEQRFCGVLDQ